MNHSPDSSLHRSPGDLADATPTRVTEPSHHTDGFDTDGFDTDGFGTDQVDTAEVDGAEDAGDDVVNGSIDLDLIASEFDAIEAALPQLDDGTYFSGLDTHAPR